MVRIGIIGIGFMGMIHYYGAKKVSGAAVVAICTRDQKKLDGDWTSIQGNFGPRGGLEDLSHLRRYDQIEALLADPDIDMVDICLPTHLHKSVSIAALKAGKHVLVEKPITINLDDANEMVQVGAESGRHFMVAHVLPFFAEFAYAKQAVEGGAYGKLLGGHLKRVISKLTWSRELTDLEKGGGPGIDLHIHDTHFIQLLCGVPDAVFSQGKLAGGNFVEYLTTQYIYNDKDLSISCSSGAVSQQGRAFSHGFELYLEKATLLFEFATLGGGPVTSMPLTLLTDDGEVHKVDLGDGDPVGFFTNELQYAVDAINQGQEPTVLSGTGARDALLLCYKEAESVKTGEVMRLS
ncbi:MAG: Gfo/Idh/MocA family oxidoreductase [Candidatus Poribacteria bacterium]|nr:Gfo/Idh/MocA family oxidoreductase [Candidatus Poribacteria bacterium]